MGGVLGGVVLEALGGLGLASFVGFDDDLFMLAICVDRLNSAGSCSDVAT